MKHVTAHIRDLRTNEQGFTLIELLVVIGILAILLAITLVAINPAKQFASANDTKRQSDVNEILNSIDQYASDNKGNLPPNMPAVGGASKIIGSGAGEADVCSSLVPKYIAQLPSDPKTGTPQGSVADCTVTYHTQYTASVSASNSRVTVSATAETPGTTISVSR